MRTTKTSFPVNIIGPLFHPLPDDPPGTLFGTSPQAQDVLEQHHHLRRKHLTATALSPSEPLRFSAALLESRLKRPKISPSLHFPSRYHPRPGAKDWPGCPAHAFTSDTQFVLESHTSIIRSTNGVCICVSGLGHSSSGPISNQSRKLQIQRTRQ